MRRRMGRAAGILAAGVLALVAIAVPIGTVAYTAAGAASSIQ